MGPALRSDACVQIGASYPLFFLLQGRLPEELTISTTAGGDGIGDDDGDDADVDEVSELEDPLPQLPAVAVQADHDIDAGAQAFVGRPPRGAQDDGSGWPRGLARGSANDPKSLLARIRGVNPGILPLCSKVLIVRCRAG